MTTLRPNKREAPAALMAVILTLVAMVHSQGASWTGISPIGSVRQNHTATLLLNGKVLVTGGWNGTNALASAELFDPSRGSWTTSAVMRTSRYYPRHCLLAICTFRKQNVLELNV